MEIKQSDNGQRGKFVAYIKGEKAGLISYTVTAVGCIALTHTEVDNKFRGQKVGQQILEEIVDYARENNILIMPFCSFTQAMFQQHDEYADVLMR